MEAKEALSADTEVTVPVALPGITTTVRLTRAEFDEMARPAIEETVAATRRALRSAGVEPAELSAIVLVGGSSRIPLVSELLSATFGRPLALGTHPKHDVAVGAALRGSRLATATHVTAPLPTVPAPTHPLPISAPPADAAPDTVETAPVGAGTAPDPGPEHGQPKHPAGPATGPGPAGPSTAPTPATPPALLPVGRQDEPGTGDDPGIVRPRPAGTGRRRYVAATAGVTAVVAATLLGVVLVRGGGSPGPTSSGGTSTTARPTTSASTTPAPTAPGSPTRAGPDLPAAAEPLSADVVIASRLGPDRTERLVLVSTRTGRTLPSGWKSVAGRLFERPVLSHDRRTVLFLDIRGEQTTLMVAAADGTGQARPLFPGGAPDCPSPRRPAWHEASDTVALQCRNGRPPDDTRTLRLTKLATPDRSRFIDSGSLGDPQIGPDGGTMVWWKGTTAQGAGGSLRTLALTDPDARPRQLTSSTSDRDPAISPDGRTVVYRRDRGGPTGYDLYTVPLDGGAERRLTNTSARDEDPTWSPDGRQVAFRCDGRLCLVDVATRTRRTLSRSGVLTPVWASPT